MYDPDKHHRRSIRLDGYDYANPGAYFITIYVHERRCLFGDVAGDEMHLNEAGSMIQAEWNRLSERFPFVILDQLVVMPNHIHGLLGIDGNDHRRGEPCVRPLSDRGKGEHKVRPDGTSTDSLGRIVQAFKSITTNAYISGVKQRAWARFEQHLWQSNYFEHIVRDNRSLYEIREYIFTNPQRWAMDRENPSGNGKDDVAGFLRGLDSRRSDEGEHEVRPYGDHGAL
jgi:REP element-mobilizing transposase RayT